MGFLDLFLSPMFWAGLFGAGASIYGIHAQTSAAKDAAAAQSQANTQALDFQKSAAENQYQNEEVTRRANYDLYAARQGSYNQVRQAMGLPPIDVPAYAPGVDPRFTGAATPTTTVHPSSTGINMPQGIDPRFAALYQKYGVTPGPRGSGPADWQYYQNDAVKNAGGDVGYILSRLERDLQGGPAPAAAPRSVGSLLTPSQPMALPPSLYAPTSVGAYMGA